LEDPGIDCRIILRWIFRKWDVRAWTGLIWLMIGAEAGTCVCSNELLGSINMENLTSLEVVSFSRRTLLHGISKQATAPIFSKF